MSRKLIEVNHHLSSGCCMWSGIEDVYATKTGQEIPEGLFLTLSSVGETAFIKRGDKSFLFSLADGRTKKTYDQIKDIIGLHYQISEARTLQYALTSIYKEIDKGKPVILGPLDMYHLPYLKMYHNTHIPMHYVLMAGYDKTKDCVLIYDCDRVDLIELPVSELIQAWQIEKNVVGDKNGFIRFELKDNLPNLYELADICLFNKAKRQLCDKPSFVGINVFDKIANEFPNWEKSFSTSELKDILTSLTEFFATVPKIPYKILGIDKKEDFLYQGNYDRLAKILLLLGNQYQRQDWVEASKHFKVCGIKIEEITNSFVEYCCDEKESLKDIPTLFKEIGVNAKKAYEIIIEDREGK